MQYLALVCLPLATLALAQSGNITTVAGTGVAGYSGDGGPAVEARIASPNGVATDRNGNVYIADYSNSRIRRVDPSGNITTIAGCGSASATCTQNTMQAATRTLVFGPWDVAVDLSGNLYFPNSGSNRLQQVLASTGILYDYAGSGASGSSAGFSGDGGPAVLAKLNNPIGTVIDAQGNLYFADVNNQRIRKITPQGVISTIAGTGTAGFSGDGGLATDARLNAPHGVAVDGAGNVYIADTTNYRIRKITPDGVISTIAGAGTPTTPSAPAGDGGPARNATLAPWDVDVDAAGNLYVSDRLGNRIRKIDAITQIITTIAGNGVAGFAGDNGPAAGSQVNSPTGIHVDSEGNVYFADNLNHRIRKISAGPPGPPAIRANNPVIPAFLGKAGFSSNSYIEIYGNNLAPASRIWSAADFNGPNAPTSLAGVSVAINNKPAFVYYVSPSQINVNVPDDTATGPVEIRVSTPAGTSTTLAERTRLSPTLHTVPQFLIGGKQYVVALTPDFSSYIGRPNMLPGVSFVAPKPGDTVSMFAIGLGPTVPGTEAGITAAFNADLALPLELRIGNVQANVTFKGILQNTIGLYQLNVVIPNVPAGDQPIELSVDGVKNQQDLWMVIGQ